MIMPPLRGFRALIQPFSIIINPLGFKIQPLIHIIYWILVIARISGRDIKCFRLNPEGLHVYRKNPNEPDVRPPGSNIARIFVVSIHM